MNDKKYGSIVALGPFRAGKSTLMGHFFLLSAGGLERLDPMRRHWYSLAEPMGRTHMRYAWILDSLRSEKERGFTIDRHYHSFETQSKFYTLFMVPGISKYISNLITCVVHSDVALLVVSAIPGEFEQTTQMCEHALIAFAFGIKRLIVAVNKMDHDTVNYSHDRFCQIYQQTVQLLGKNFTAAQMDFVPVSGSIGDNLRERSANLPWWEGPTLLEAFDNLKLPNREALANKPLRITINKTWRIGGVGTVLCARVESGTLRGSRVVVTTPPQTQIRVKSIEKHHVSQNEAKPGDVVGINIVGLSWRDVTRGQVLYDPEENAPPSLCQVFKAKVYIVDHPTRIKEGYSPVFYCQTTKTLGKWTKFHATYDEKTGKEIEVSPQYLKTGDVAIVTIELAKPRCLDKWDVLPALGRFIVRDATTVAIGKIIEMAPCPGVGRLTKPAKNSQS